MIYPDAQRENTEADRRGRITIEIASGHNRQQSILATSSHGFVLHATGHPERVCSEYSPWDPGNRFSGESFRIGSHSLQFPGNGVRWFEGR